MSQRYTSGVVLGKFMPPHHGHRLVINTALAQCDRVTLLVSVLPIDSIPAEQRQAWLQRLYPTATVIIMTVRWDVTDAQAWADGALAALGGQRPAAVFSSENYGQLLAELWSCTHVMVDRERSAVPISSRTILEHPEASAAYIEPDILRYLVDLKK
jgi:cytidyltransferase-like protein